jgi:hypothetical protein
MDSDGSGYGSMSGFVKGINESYLSMKVIIVKHVLSTF